MPSSATRETGVGASIVVSLRATLSQRCAPLQLHGNPVWRVDTVHYHPKITAIIFHSQIISEKQGECSAFQRQTPPFQPKDLPSTPISHAQLQGPFQNTPTKVLFRVNYPLARKLYKKTAHWLIIKVVPSPEEQKKTNQEKYLLQKWKKK